jgi:4-hydroxysphinganine ceramide fatty acyl 2-hydroxylase
VVRIGRTKISKLPALVLLCYMKMTACSEQSTVTSVETEKKVAQTAKDRRDQFLTLDEPIFNQFFTKNFSKELYLEQVHIPRQITYSARFFESDFCEALTKNHWWITPAVWFPVAAVMYYMSAVENTTKLAIFVLGLFVWTLFEYVFHRFVFHCDEMIPDNRYFLMLHFFTHAVHHYFPFDRLRLAMPPALFTILATPTWCLFNLFVPTQPLLPFFSGIFVGFTFYDVIHFYLHHGAEKSVVPHIRRMRTYHAIHHYKEPDRGFGVTSKLWDRIFGTLIVPGRKKGQ